MQIPTFLQKGDKIAITSTARKLSPKSIQYGLNAALHFGFEPVVSNTIGQAHNIFAGTDELRAAELQALINNPEIKAIWLARGGYGSLRVLDKIDWTALTNSPKWLIGFSDITNLLLEANLHNVATIHGPMPKTVPSNYEDDASINMLFSLLMGNPINYNWTADNIGSGQSAKGIITGGNLANLANLYPSLGSSFFNDKILFIEEIDEYLYQIDRMLRGMKRSGHFDNLNGIILGDFSNIKDNDDPFGEKVNEIVTNVFGGLNIPILTSFKAGHESTNWPLVFGVKHTLMLENGVCNLSFNE